MNANNKYFNINMRSIEKNYVQSYKLNVNFVKKK